MSFGYCISSPVDGPKMVKFGLDRSDSIARCSKTRVEGSISLEWLSRYIVFSLCLMEDTALQVYTLPPTVFIRN
jgi:hypothetical protein